jgi:uncharacterized protein (TIGR00369 family)
MTVETHFRKLERMYMSAPINQYFGPRLRIEHSKAELRIPVRPEFFHPLRAVHGCVYFKALDDAAFFAVNSLVEDVFVLTASFNIYMTRPISEGEMIATGRVVHASRRLFVGESVLTDSEGREIGRGSGNFMRSGVHLTADVGYA